MDRRFFLNLAGSAAVSNLLRPAAFSANAPRPNILLIYADDLGYGDLGCYGAKNVTTPNLDRMAKAGVRFTDAHSSSATCTPSRYSMLTGEYAWRKKGTGVLPGDARLIIDPKRPTLPNMLQNAGYRTGVVGKWHLGLGDGNLDWNGEIKPGPLEIGFDSAFLMPATGDRVPCVYVKDRRVVGLDPKDPIRVDYQKPIGDEPTGRKNPELLKMHPSHGHDMAIVNGVSRIGYMTGGKSALWVDEDMAAEFVKRGIEFIDQKRREPFFLYFATHGIHVPRLPNRRFTGKTSMGPRGDAIAELDWTAGQLLDHLERRGLAKNTLVIFTSDNGPVVDDGYKDDAVEKLGSHKPAGHLRGGKYSNFEGGTRVPMIARWPERIKSGVSGALVGQQDFFASFATLSGAKLGEDAAPDSFDVLPALLGESRTGRDWIVEHARALSIRRGEYKLIETNPGLAVSKNTNIEMGTGSGPQLYRVTQDPGEQKNLAGAMPDKVKELSALLEKVKASPRSRVDVRTPVDNN
ncbi:MAG TPA: arylsulfatase [Bryobacteraceae bacterium]|nr:arylsulfatase [Bryobacteraceae bacterium]